MLLLLELLLELLLLLLLLLLRPLRVVGSGSYNLRPQTLQLLEFVGSDSCRVLGFVPRQWRLL